MEVNNGWSEDYGKVRFDVTAQEVDLLRMLAERGVEDPVAVASRMTTQDVYKALDNDGMAFVHHSRGMREPEDSAARQGHMIKVREHRAERDLVLAKYAPPPAPE
jgi:hypothetical protein